MNEPPSLDGVAFCDLIADRASDSNAMVTDLDTRGVRIAASRHPCRAKPLPLDHERYKSRHLIENVFGRLGKFTRIP